MAGREIIFIREDQPDEILPISQEALQVYGLCGGVIALNGDSLLRNVLTGAPADVSATSLIQTLIATQYGSAISLTLPTSATENVVVPTGVPANRNFTFTARVRAFSNGTHCRAGSANIFLWRSSNNISCRIGGTTYNTGVAWPVNVLLDITVISNATAIVVMLNDEVIYTGSPAGTTVIPSAATLGEDGLGGSGAAVDAQYVLFMDRAHTPGTVNALRRSLWASLYGNHRAIIPVSATAPPVEFENSARVKNNAVSSLTTGIPLASSNASKNNSDQSLSSAITFGNVSTSSNRFVNEFATTAAVFGNASNSKSAGVNALSVQILFASESQSRNNAINQIIGIAAEFANISLNRNNALNALEPDGIAFASVSRSRNNAQNAIDSAILFANTSLSKNNQNNALGEVGFSFGNVARSKNSAVNGIVLKAEFFNVSQSFNNWINRFDIDEYGNSKAYHLVLTTGGYDYVPTVQGTDLIMAATDFGIVLNE